MVIRKCLFLFFLMISLFLVGCMSDESGGKNNLKNGQENQKKGKNLETSINSSQNNLHSNKDMTPEELDKKIQKKVKENNKPSSDYVFAKELDRGTVDIVQVQKAGGIEVGHGNIYLYGLSDGLESVGDKLLNKEEKKYVFRKKGTEGKFFYFTNRNIKEILKEPVSNGLDYEILKEHSNDKRVVIKIDKGILIYSKDKGSEHGPGKAMGLNMHKVRYDNSRER